MTEKSSRSFYSWMRILHRDIGFLVIGVTVVYAISGFVLTYREADIFKTETHIEKQIQPGLPASQLGRALRVHGQLKIVNENESTITFVDGTYNKKTGDVSYTSQEFLPVLKQFNDLHFVSSKDSRHWFTACYAVLLLFLALSSFGMYKPGTKLFKRGLSFAAVGLIGAVLLLML